MPSLEELTRLPAGPPRNRCTDLLQEGELDRATARHITVQTTDGRTTIEPPGGVTPGLYDRLAPFLREEEQATLADGVLQNLVQPLNLLEWQTVMVDAEEWLPGAIEALGFDALAAVLKQHLEDQRRTVHPSRRRLAWVENPTWDSESRVLEYGKHRWQFRSDARVIRSLLEALERNGWKSVNLCNPGQPGMEYLEPEQVHEAARNLRLKTKSVLYWRAASDGQLSWEPL